MSVLCTLMSFVPPRTVEPDGHQFTVQEVRNAKGDNIVSLQGVPHVGDLISFARKCFKVVEVRHVHNNVVNLLVSVVDNPAVASYSSR